MSTVRVCTAVVLGIVLVWVGWKITEVTIMESWLNELGLVVIYIGVILTHFSSLDKIYMKVRELLFKLQGFLAIPEETSKKEGKDD